MEAFPRLRNDTPGTNIFNRLDDLRALRDDGAHIPSLDDDVIATTLIVYDLFPSDEQSCWIHVNSFTGRSFETSKNIVLAGSLSRHKTTDKVFNVVSIRCHTVDLRDWMFFRLDSHQGSGTRL